MSKIYETGHAKNVANFQLLIANLKGYGVSYNPTKTAIQLPNLLLLSDAATVTVTNLNTLTPNYSNAVAEREKAFAPLSKLSTKIFNSLKATDVIKQVLDNAETNHRKLTGRRVGTKISETAKQALLAEGKEVKQISTSQQSYDNQLESFDKQIKLLASIPLYKPNEVDLQVPTLEALYKDLKQKNETVVSQSVPVNAARNARNEVLYNQETGIVAVAQSVKNYVKSVFGASSNNYKLISGIAIRKLKL